MTPAILTILMALNGTPTPSPPSPMLTHTYYPEEECGPRCRERRAWREREREREYWRREHWRREHERYPYAPPPMRY